MGIPAADMRFGGWSVGPVVARRPAGVARDALQSETGTRAVLVVVDARFIARTPPDADAVARAAVIGAPSVVPMLDAGLLDDGTRWYVTPAPPGPVLDPTAGCSPRRAASVAEEVARALAAVHAAGLVHGLVGPQSVVPAAGRHAERPVERTLLLDTGVAALVGDRAADLAAAAGMTLPRDRGSAADVHALGALLLRMLTAAAPAGPALAALPVGLRALLSEMLDDDPGRRPGAAAVAQRLGALREGLLATGPVALPQPPSRTATTGPRTSGPVPTAAAGPVPSAVAAPAPLRAPRAVDVPRKAPRPLAAAAPSLRTGPIDLSGVERPARGRGRTALLAVGGVGLAGLLVGVLAHLPAAQGAGMGSVAVAAKDGAVGVPALRSPSMRAADAQSPASTASAGSSGSGASPAASSRPAAHRTATSAASGRHRAASSSSASSSAVSSSSAAASPTSSPRSTSTAAHRTGTPAPRASTPRSTAPTSAVSAGTPSVRVPPHRPTPVPPASGTPAATPSSDPSSSAVGTTPSVSDTAQNTPTPSPSLPTVPTSTEH